MIDYKIPFKKVISDEIKEKINSFSDWIDFWSIDFEFENEIFKNMWYSFRTPKRRTISLKSEVYQYEGSGNYEVSVKIIDILGIVTTKSYPIRVT